MFCAAVSVAVAADVAAEVVTVVGNSLYYNTLDLLAP